MRTNVWPPPGLTQGLVQTLEQRLGRLHARQRLGIEKDYEAHIFGHGINFFHIENWYSIHSVIRNTLKLTGLYWRGCRNAENIQVRHHDVRRPELPTAFDGFTILHLSDMHVDISQGAMQRLIELLPGVRYDICVLTGDFRGKTFGPFDATLEGLARVRAHLKDPVYGVLGKPRYGLHGARHGRNGHPNVAQRSRDDRSRQSAHPCGGDRRRPLLSRR